MGENYSPSKTFRRRDKDPRNPAGSKYFKEAHAARYSGRGRFNFPESVNVSLMFSAADRGRGRRGDRRDAPCRGNLA